jgi:hypothetical protein
MTYAIIGSRDFNAYATFKATMDLYVDITHIISGGARGPDSLAERYANEKKIPFTCYPADWTTHGKSAGYKRNVDIVGNADVVVAFWDGVSKGTRHSLTLADNSNKPYFIHLTNVKGV